MTFFKPIASPCLQNRQNRRAFFFTRMSKNHTNRLITPAQVHDPPSRRACLLLADSPVVVHRRMQRSCLLPDEILSSVHESSVRFDAARGEVTSRHSSMESAKPPTSGSSQSPPGG